VRPWEAGSVWSTKEAENEPENGSFEIIGHRGVAAKYPENTLLSFKAAMELGADAIEFDVHMTRDASSEQSEAENSVSFSSMSRLVTSMTMYLPVLNRAEERYPMTTFISCAEIPLA
jgi:hypothetical protein